MDRKRLNLKALRAFECAARLGSFSRAADELCVTHAAISHQIKALEQQLKAELFIRQGNGVELSNSGKRLQPHIKAAFDKMEAAIDTAFTLTRGKSVGVTATPSFASKWLVPRLARFRSRYPDIDVRVQPTLAYLNFEESVDVGIRCGKPPWAGLKHDPLMPIHLMPVCSPAFLAGIPKPKKPEDLLKVPLIHADIDTRPVGEEWQLWLTAYGVNSPSALPGESFHDPALAMNAALNGFGLAMGYQELMADEIAAGQLVTPFPKPVRHPLSYYLVYRDLGSEPESVGKFRKWMRAEAAANDKN